jgi:hypothetical protein
MTVSPSQPIENTQDTARGVLSVFGVVGQWRDGLVFDGVLVRAFLVYLTVDAWTQTLFLEGTVPALTKQGPSVRYMTIVVGLDSKASTKG